MIGCRVSERKQWRTEWVSEAWVRLRLHEYVFISFSSKPQTFLCVFTLHLNENDQNWWSFSLKMITFENGLWSGKIWKRYCYNDIINFQMIGCRVSEWKQWRTEWVSEAQSTRIRFHIVFIETTNFSLHFHLASKWKQSKLMIVFTENDNFWKWSPKWKDLKTILL